MRGSGAESGTGVLGNCSIPLGEICRDRNGQGLQNLEDLRHDSRMNGDPLSDILSLASARCAEVDILEDGIRSVWSRPLFTREGKALATFSTNYRESRSPSVNDLKLIENASHIVSIAIERHMNEQAQRCERDRPRLLLEITNSMTSKLDLRRLVESPS
jgi:GAF domain-containing protein